MSAEANKNVVRRYREIHNSNRLDELDAIVAADIVSHSALPGLPPGLEGGKMAHMGALSAFEGLNTKTEMLVAEGDRVVEFFTTTGKHTGDFLGIPATGRSINVQGISIFRLANGKIVEHWGVNDGFGLLMQLGVVPAPGQ
ncbi:MAG: ester cyclase [Caldilineaceae bacterium]|nr:ester cyclase [Caldilineaceae bacterium]